MLYVKMTIEELALSGKLGFPRATKSTLYNHAKTLNEHLENHGYDWRVKAYPKEKVIAVVKDGHLNRYQKHEIAGKIMNALENLDMLDMLFLQTDETVYIHKTSLLDKNSPDARTLKKAQTRHGTEYVTFCSTYGFEDNCDRIYKGDTVSLMTVHPYAIRDTGKTYKDLKKAVDKIANRYGFHLESLGEHAMVLCPNTEAATASPETTVVEVTMEKTFRVAINVDVTNEQLKMLKNGDNPFFDRLEEDIKNGSAHYETDYAVNDTQGRNIVDWSK